MLYEHWGLELWAIRIKSEYYINESISKINFIRMSRDSVWIESNFSNTTSVLGIFFFWETVEMLSQSVPPEPLEIQFGLHEFSLQSVQLEKHLKLNNHISIQLVSIITETVDLLRNGDKFNILQTKIATAHRNTYFSDERLINSYAGPFISPPRPDVSDSNRIITDTRL